LERGADINVKNNDGDTPLISAAIGAAAIRPLFESVRVDLEAVRVEDSDREKALFYSEMLCRRLEVVRVLLLVWMFENRPGLVVRPII
jgi:ankyrin repeat protein